MTACASGANHEDFRSLMGQCRVKGVAKRVSMTRVISEAEAGAFLTAFSDSLYEQITKRRGVVPSFFEAVKAGAERVYRVGHGMLPGLLERADDPVMYNENIIRPRGQ